MKSADSGSLEEVVPVIFPSELYVIPGDVLIAAFSLLQQQRKATLYTIDRLPAFYTKDVDNSLARVKNINDTMANLAFAMPILKFNETTSNIETSISESKTINRSEPDYVIDINELLKRNKINVSEKKNDGGSESAESNDNTVAS